MALAQGKNRNLELLFQFLCTIELRKKTVLKSTCTRLWPVINGELLTNITESNLIHGIKLDVNAVPKTSFLVRHFYRVSQMQQTTSDGSRRKQMGRPLGARANRGPLQVHCACYMICFLLENFTDAHLRLSQTRFANLCQIKCACMLLSYKVLTVQLAVVKSVLSQCLFHKHTVNLEL